MLTFFVPGRAATQGSKDYLGRSPRGKVRAKESDVKLPAWREDVRRSAIEASAIAQQSSYVQGTPVYVRLVFVRQRTVSAPKRRPWRLWAPTKPDIDKLTRAVLDALTSAGVYFDDGQVCRLVVEKVMAAVGEVPGCAVTVDMLDELANPNPFAA